MTTYDTWLAAPYLDQDDAQGRWEQRTAVLDAARPETVAALAELVDCGLRTWLDRQALTSLETALRGWLGGLDDGELEDRIAVELGTVAEWERP